MTTEKSTAAQDLARHRWAKATDEDRKNIGAAMAEGRRKAARKRKKKRAKKATK